jgi:hypothetical protein
MTLILARWMSSLSAMTRGISLDLKPPLNKGMKHPIDTSAFRSFVPLLAVRVPAQKTGLVLHSQALKGFVVMIV